MRIKKIIKKNKIITDLIKTKLLAILIIILFNTSSQSNEKKTLNEIAIQTSEFSYDRIIGFIKGDFFSYSENKKITKALGMYFALSESGSNTAISYCQDFLMTCDKNLVKIRTKMLCERISNEKCKIIFNEDKFLINNKRINVKKIEELKKYFIIVKESNNFNQNNHQEIRIPNSSETSDGSKWNM